jgi:hypothetical protein
LPSPGEPYTTPDRLLARLPGKVEDALRRDGLLRADERLAVIDARAGVASAVGPDGVPRRFRLGEGFEVTNVDGVAFTLLSDKPGSIEIAGVILLMAMLGAVVLARKQVQIDEEAKARHAATLAARAEGVP